MSINNWSQVFLQLYEFSNLLSYNRAFLAPYVFMTDRPSYTGKV